MVGFCLVNFALEFSEWIFHRIYKVAVSDVISAKVSCGHNKLFQKLSETTSGQCFDQIETIQLICVKTQLAGFYMM